MFGPQTQGFSCVATLGFVTKSLWDLAEGTLPESPREREEVVSYKVVSAFCIN